MSFVGPDELITTTQAAELTGRTISSIRTAINDGRLTRLDRTDLGRPLVSRRALLEWHRSNPPKTQPSGDAYERTWQLLADMGPATPDELSIALGIHVGNVRKHLAYLYRDGRAHRCPTREWVITEAQAGAA